MRKLLFILFLFLGGGFFIWIMIITFPFLLIIYFIMCIVLFLEAYFTEPNEDDQNYY